MTGDLYEETDQSGRRTVERIFLSLLIACQRNETPAPTPAASAEQTATAAKSEPPKCADCVPVTADNFPRAETDLYFASPIKQAGGIGKFYHYREKNHSKQTTSAWQSNFTNPLK